MKVTQLGGIVGQGAAEHQARTGGGQIAGDRQRTHPAAGIRAQHQRTVVQRKRAHLGSPLKGPLAAAREGDRLCQSGTAAPQRGGIQCHMHLRLRHQPCGDVIGVDHHITVHLRAVFQPHIEAAGDCGIQRQCRSVATRQLCAVGQGQARITAATHPNTTVLHALQRTTVDAQAATVVDHCGPRALAFGANVGVGQCHCTAATGQYAVCLLPFGTDDAVLKLDAAALACHRTDRTASRGVDLHRTCVDARPRAKGRIVGVQPVTALAGGGHLHTFQVCAAASHVDADSAIPLADDRTAGHGQR